jgi:AmmeMemoRadiSam system protein B
MKKKNFAFATILSFLFLITAGYPSPASGEEKEGENIRPPAVAGTFYPGSPAKLRRSITELLDSVPQVKPAGEILAAVAPHAGYTYSGGVAAYTHKLLSTVQFDTLVIIGHDTYRNAVAFTCPVDYFQTPLGKVPVDREMMAKLHAFNRGIKAHPSLHARDHTVEVHLPFLQVLDKQVKIIPILFGNPTAKNCQILSEAILAAAGGKTVFVLASADMSHYPPYESAREVDNSTLEVLTSLDVGKLFTHLAKQERQPSVPNLRTAMCAKGGVGTAILVARAHGADHAQILRYANSGDVPAGGKRRVVGYGSVLMVKTAAHPSK